MKPSKAVYTFVITLFSSISCFVATSQADVECPCGGRAPTTLLCRKKCQNPLAVIEVPYLVEFKIDGSEPVKVEGMIVKFENKMFNKVYQEILDKNPELKKDDPTGTFLVERRDGSTVFVPLTREEVKALEKDRTTVEFDAGKITLTPIEGGKGEAIASGRVELTGLKPVRADG